MYFRELYLIKLYLHLVWYNLFFETTKRAIRIILTTPSPVSFGDTDLDPRPGPARPRRGYDVTFFILQMKWKI